MVFAPFVYRIHQPLYDYVSMGGNVCWVSVYSKVDLRKLRYNFEPVSRWRGLCGFNFGFESEKKRELYFVLCNINFAFQRPLHSWEIIGTSVAVDFFNFHSVPWGLLRKFPLYNVSYIELFGLYSLLSSIVYYLCLLITHDGVNF